MVKYVELSPSLWGYIRRCLKTLQDSDTYLGLVIGHMTKQHRATIVVGDLNSSRSPTGGGAHRNLLTWMEDALLSSGLTLDEEAESSTRWSGQSNPTGHIDHILFTPGHGVTHRFTQIHEDSLWFGTTDHRPVIAAFQLPHGRPEGHPTLPMIYPKDLNLGDDDEIERYVVELRSRWVALELPTADATPDEVSAILLNMSHILYSSTEAVVGKARPQTATYKDGWSPQLLAYKAHLTALTEIRRHLLGEKHRHKWEAAHIASGIRQQIDRWVSTVTGLHWQDLKEMHQFLDVFPDHGPAFWRTTSTDNPNDLAEICSRDCARILTKLHGRQRSEMRSSISAATAQRERLLQEGKIGRAIKSILGTESGKFTYDTLHTPEGLLTDPVQIHNRVAQHFQSWFDGPSEFQTGIHAQEMDWSTIITDADRFRSHAMARAVPPHLTELIWKAVQYPITHHHSEAFRRRLTDLLNIDPTFEEFVDFIKASTAGSAAGITGASYNMLKAAPIEILEDIYNAMLRLWRQRHIPNWWQWRLLSAIPKVPDSNSLDNLRPLMLTECFRKIWTTIPLRKIQREWERTNILASEQHGFRPGRGTESAILQLTNLLSHSHEEGTALYSTFWDISRAFDSVSKPVLKAAWCRLGVPQRDADWFVGMDMGGGVIPRSPLASSQVRDTATHTFEHINTNPPGLGFFTTRRGCSQGDPASPANWTAFFDILLRALQMVDDSPAFFQYTTGIPFEGKDSAYADDLATLSGSQMGLQRKMEIVSAFATIFGLIINIKKLRLLGTAPHSCTVHTYTTTWLDDVAQWTQLPLRVDVVGHVRYLGFEIDIDPDHQTQFTMARTMAKKIVAVISSRMASPDLKYIVARTSTMAKLAYPLRFSSWPLSHYRKLDHELSLLFRRSTRNQPTFPTALLYLPTSHGGMGLKRLSDLVQLDKWSSLHRLLRGDRQSEAVGISFIHQAYRRAHIHPPYNTASTYAPHPSPASPSGQRTTYPSTRVASSTYVERSPLTLGLKLYRQDSNPEASTTMLKRMQT